jgi:3-oxoacyl-[acyl-carrier protein] reductase
MSIAGQVALVTGGGSGIGEGIALRLARDGATVVVADVNAEAATRVADAITAAGGTAAAQAMDVTDEAQVDAAVGEAERRFGRLRIAVCNAGITDRVPVLDMSPDPGGRIVTISSVSGQFGGTGRAAYGASKGGIEMLTRVLATELAPAGILVNGVAPGPVQVARTAHGPRQRAAFLDRMAVKRYGTPADVAAAVAFLCSAENGFVTGQILNVDGGFASSGVMYDPAEGA